jgi:hypothetical protein
MFIECAPDNGVLHNNIARDIVAQDTRAFAFRDDQAIESLPVGVDRQRV